jgi:peptidoglycan hydrolase-like protein with peptidoglycan-binding domain
MFSSPERCSFPASALAGGNQQSSRMEPPAGQSSATQHSSAVIKQVQEKLNTAGYDPGPVDGMFGPRTEQALTAFQGAEGLEASGQLDSQTLAALEIDGSADTGSTAAGGSAEPTS